MSQEAFLSKMIVCVFITLSSLSAFAAGKSKIVNIRYNFLGPMLEVGVGKFGIGVTTASSTYESTSLSTFSAKSTLMGARLSWYSNGMGTSSWYLGVDGGSVSTDFSETISTVKYTGTNSSSYMGGEFGYHWFWDYFNLSFGLGALSLNVGNTQVKDSGGTIGDTISGFALTIPVIDLGIGIAF